MSDDGVAAGTIDYLREIARTQASIEIDGKKVVGSWSAGDLQATRSLATVLANQVLLYNLDQQRIAERLQACAQLTQDAVAQREEALAGQRVLQDAIQKLVAANLDLREHNAKLYDQINDLKNTLAEAQRQYVRPGADSDPWADVEGMAFEWGTEHTLLDQYGEPASTPLVINLGQDRAAALQRLDFWHQHLGEHSRVRFVRRSLTSGPWLEEATAS